jgi:hypothetical protein
MARDSSCDGNAAAGRRMMTTAVAPGKEYFARFSEARAAFTSY